MDVMAVLEATQRAADSLRAGGGPMFLEFRTYRFRAHSMFDPELYRSKTEVEHWKQHCPIVSFSTALKKQGLLDDAAMARLEQDIEAEIAEAVAFAEAGTWEPVELLTRDVYTPGNAS
jgi:pyruvate dehydrogenase E1 component alpha subunit